MKKTLETTSPGVVQTLYVLTPVEEADINASLADAAQGEFATDEEVRAVWAKHGAVRVRLVGWALRHGP